MTDLTEMVDWLRGVVSGDLQKAKAATSGPWSVNSENLAETIYGAEDVAVVAGSRWGGEAPVFESDADALHIATHDPRDTIARCEAELAIIDEHPRTQAGSKLGKECKTCSGDHWGEPYPCPTLRALAYGYRNRDGWKETWRP